MFRSSMIVAAVAMMCLAANAAEPPIGDSGPRRLILAHYMPWYVAKPHSRVSVSYTHLTLPTPPYV